MLPLFRICKWLDFLVFSDKDEKPFTQSHSTFTVFTDLTVIVRGIRILTAARRVGDVYPAGVVNLW